MIVGSKILTSTKKERQVCFTAQPWGRKVQWGWGVVNSFSSQGTYKEALLRRSKTLHPSAILPQKKPIYYQGPKKLLTNNLAKRCFWCLAEDHKAAACRNPVRCLKCLRFRHRANQCKNKRRYKVVDSMYRSYQRPGRVPVSKVFVPYTEEYLRRLELRHNAVLADVLQPANLGPDPIITIKNAMARRFGAIPTILRSHGIGRGISRSSCRSGSQLSPRVAAIVGGFGRFVKADATTRATTDLRAFRCQIVLDSVFDVPQNLSIVLGEVLYSVMVHLESWERIEDVADGDPPISPQNGSEEGEMDEDEIDINNHSGGEGDRAAVEEKMGAGAGEVEEGEVPEQTRAIRPASAVRQAELVREGRRGRRFHSCPA
uniref:CCHC-type domain-containing protein n=1 Tax=Ananas comosus var. bracteatus TaxID=296719 RepID=A0A6V7PHF2_ANACO|nr:unnamed protein product [Ananas comosus var. bracteatus]